MAGTENFGGGVSGRAVEALGQRERVSGGGIKFDALDTVQREGGQVARIAVRSAEAPRALLERADVVVDGPTGLAALLTQLAEEISSPG